MNQIPEKFSKNGFHYKLLRRNDRACIYTQSTVEDLPVGGRACAYEVMRIRTRDAQETPNFSVRGGEYLPTTREWGSQGWTFPELAGAEAKFGEISTNLPQPATGKPPS